MLHGFNSLHLPIGIIAYAFFIFNIILFRCSLPDPPERTQVYLQSYNQEHGITPVSIKKSLETPFDSLYTQAAEHKEKLKPTA